MRTFWLCLCLLGSSLVFNLQAQTKTVKIDRIPGSVKEFFELRNRIAGTPEGGAAAFIVASIIYSRDKQLGRHCLIIAADADLLQSSSASQAYEGFDFARTSDYLVKQLDSKPHVPYTYIKGTSPAKGYEIGNGPYELVFPRTVPQGQSGGKDVVQLYVRCSGADSDRPISVRRNDAGHWKAINFSSIVVGTRPPVTPSKGAASGDF